MSTFKEIRGQLIKSLASDPSPVTTGDIWYNSTTKLLKGVQAVGAWSSGGALNTARESGASSSEGATQNAAFYAGGTTPYRANSEEYNGTSWSEGNDLNTARAQMAGAGSQTAGLAFSGYNPGGTLAISEEYNGTSWAEGNDLNVARFGMAGFGSQTAGVGCAGYGTANTTLSEEYNGTSWTEGNNLNTARYGVAGTGSQTAGIAIGGSPGNTSVELYNGTDWTNASVLPSGRGTNAGNQAFGIQTSCFFLGGQPPANGTTTVQAFDGTNWSAGASLATAVKQNSGSGSTSAGLSFAGKAGGTLTAATEEFSFVPSTKTFTTS